MTSSRHPRIRFGKVHAFNNYYDRWQLYGIGCSQLAECYSERNIFEAEDGETNAIVTQVGEDPERGSVISVNDWTLNGAQINERNTGSVFRPSDYYSYSAESSRDSLSDAIQNNAGWQGERP